MDGLGSVTALHYSDMTKSANTPPTRATTCAPVSLEPRLELNSLDWYTILQLPANYCPYILGTAAWRGTIIGEPIYCNWMRDGREWCPAPPTLRFSLTRPHNRCDWWVEVCYDRQVLGGCKSPELVAQEAAVTSALRLQLTYLSSQAMRISAMLLFLYIFFFISESGFWQV